MAVNTDVSDVPQELSDEKGKGMLAIAGSFMALLAGLETVTYLGLITPPSPDMASSIHTLFVASVSTVIAFWYKSRK